MFREDWASAVCFSEIIFRQRLEEENFTERLVSSSLIKRNLMCLFRGKPQKNLFLQETSALHCIGRKLRIGFSGNPSVVCFCLALWPTMVCSYGSTDQARRINRVWMEEQRAMFVHVFSSRQGKQTSTATGIAERHGEDWRPASKYAVRGDCMRSFLWMKRFARVLKRKASFVCIFVWSVSANILVANS